MFRFKTLILVLFFSIKLLNAQQNNYIRGEVVVKFRENSLKGTVSDQEKMVQLQVKAGAKLTDLKKMFSWQKVTKSAEGNNLENIYLVEFDENIDAIELSRKISQLNDVIYAQPYWIPEELDIPNDPYRGSQYYLSLIKAYDAFDITHGDTNILIGIVDTGIDQYHEDLAGNIKINYNDPINGIDDDMDGFIDNYRGWDLADNDNNPQSSTNHHGTYVAGLASAVANNGKGITGIGYQSKLMPIKVMNKWNFINTGWEGIVYAADHGCQIINCSWGNTEESPLYNDIIAYATEYRNCLVVAACGNARNDHKYYPAACKGVLSVAATNSADLKWSNSSYGITVDISAPGEGVFTTTYGNTYSSGWGTSFASPLVAGVAALVWAKFPDWSAEQVAEQLRITSDIIDTLPDNLFYQKEMGYGRLNAYRALTITDLPSLRITDYQVTSSGDGLFAGETIKIGLALKNYLSQVSSSTIRLSTKSPYASITKSTWATDEISTLETQSNSTSPFEFILSENVPDDYKLRLWFDINAQGYNDYQAIEMVVNPSFMNIKTSKIQTTLASNGKIGYANLENKTGMGMIYDYTFNILSDAGIIIAAGNNASASSWQDEAQFTINQRIDTSTVKNDLLSATSAYTPGSALDQDIKILQETRIFTSDYPSILFNCYRIINLGTEPTTELRIGLYCDWDLINGFSNQVNYDTENKMLYTYNHGSQSLYSGICVLNDGTAVPYAFDLIQGGNGAIDITDGFSSAEKWFVMNNAREQGGNSGDSINVASILSYVINSINASDTTEVTFAILVADNLYLLTEMAKQARIIYHDTKLNEQKNERESLVVYPNPINSEILNLNVPRNTLQISIFNQQGQMVNQIRTPNEQKESILIRNWIPGIYLIKVETDKEIIVQKIVINR
jgi:serine protease